MDDHMDDHNPSCCDHGIFLIMKNGDVSPTQNAGCTKKNGDLTRKQFLDLAVCQNLVPLVNIKIAGKWMFIPLKMVLIGIDPYPFFRFHEQH